MTTEEMIALVQKSKSMRGSKMTTEEMTKLAQRKPVIDNTPLAGMEPVVLATLKQTVKVWKQAALRHGGEGFNKTNCWNAVLAAKGIGHYRQITEQQFSYAWDTMTLEDLEAGK